jgi:hypothetical protein
MMCAVDAMGFAALNPSYGLRAYSAQAMRRIPAPPGIGVPSNHIDRPLIVLLYQLFPFLPLDAMSAGTNSYHGKA